MKTLIILILGFVVGHSFGNEVSPAELFDVLENIHSMQLVQHKGPQYFKVINELAELGRSGTKNSEVIFNRSKVYLESDDAEKRLTAIHIVGGEFSLRHPEMIKRLIQLTDAQIEKNESVRIAATLALPLGGQGVSQVMEKLLKDRNVIEGQRAAACFVLGAHLLQDAPPEKLKNEFGALFMNRGEPVLVRKSALAALAQYSAFAKNPKLNEILLGVLVDLETNNMGIESVLDLEEMRRYATEILESHREKNSMDQEN